MSLTVLTHAIPKSLFSTLCFQSSFFLLYFNTSDYSTMVSPSVPLPLPTLSRWNLRWNLPLLCFYSWFFLEDVIHSHGCDYISVSNLYPKFHCHIGLTVPIYLNVLYRDLKLKSKTKLIFLSLKHFLQFIISVILVKWSFHSLLRWKNWLHLRFSIPHFYFLHHQILSSLPH